MGGLCSRTAPENTSDGRSSSIPHDDEALSGKTRSPGQEKEALVDSTAAAAAEDEKENKVKLSRALSNRARSAKSKTTGVAKKGAAKVSEVLGRASTAGLGKAVEALDTFGSSFTSLGSGFGAGVATKGNKIGILAFEVANTIAKGYTLKQSLSPESLQILKKEVFPSEGVQRLVSSDPDELWRIAAADKRQELKMFASEVVRFGNHCRAPEWHQLGRVFNRLGTEVPIPPVDAEQVMQELLELAQNTAELYHELHALDRFQNDVRRSEDEDKGGDSLAMLKSDLKCQQKHVKLLKKRSLWSKIMEEVMGKLVDVVYYLHQELIAAFGDYKEENGNLPSNQRLGAQGLALHYANMITQIDSLVSRPGSVPPNARDNLYQGLPPSIKQSLRSALCASPTKQQELTIAQIKDEMEKILQWLVPIASNTTKAHHGFGWVGEWATAGSGVDRKQYGQEINLIQTLHHADPKTTDDYILQLLVWLNLLISRTRLNMNERKSAPLGRRPTESPPQRTVVQGSLLSIEEQELVKGAVRKGRAPGISKSQEFQRPPKALSTRLFKSHSHSPLPTMVDKSKHGCGDRPWLPELGSKRLLDLDRIDRIDTLVHP